MNIVFNGDSLTTKSQQLEQLIQSLGYGTHKIAAAVNGEFVPAKNYVDTILYEGIDVEIVAPMQGG